MKMQKIARTTGLLTFLILVLAVATDGWAQRGRGGDRAAPPQLPTVDEMAAAIDADADQRAALAEARLTWLENRAERGRTERGGHRGHRGERPTPPAVQFLVDVAPSVDTADMIALVDLLSEHGPRAGRRGDRPGRMHGRGHGGPGHGPGHGQGGPPHGRAHGAQDMLVHQLDLTDGQREQVDALYATTRGSLRALRRQVEPGEEPTDALEAEAKRIRTSHQERLAEILTPEQNDALMRLRAERRAERGSQHAERRERMQTQRLEHLTAILGLDATQRAAVEEAFEAAEQQAMKKRAERMAVGGPMPNLFESRGRRGTLRGETRDAIAEVLDPQQRELFAGLQSMMLEGGGRGMRHGEGMRHGPGGHGRGMHRGR